MPSSWCSLRRGSYLCRPSVSVFAAVAALVLLAAAGRQPANAQPPAALPPPAAGNDTDSQPDAETTYADVVAADRPAVWWRMSGDAKAARSPGDAVAPGKFRGQPAAGAAGPQRPKYPLFEVKNESLLFESPGAALVVADPGEKSPLDFALGDEITLEAWV